MRRPDPIAREVLDAYALAGRGVHVHTTIRWWTCPFAEVEALLPDDGEILDFGCGHGHFATYLARTGPRRHVFGVDIDAAKVDVGTRVLTREGLGGRVELRAVAPDWIPEPDRFDGIVTNDVQERLATKVLRITAGDQFSVLPPDAIEAPLRDGGLSVRRVPLHRGYAHAHLAVVGVRG